MKAVLDREIRKQIFDLIVENPGLHLSKIAEMLGMRTSLAEYHLTYLERNDFVFSVKEEGGYFRRYYTKDAKIGAEDKRVLALLRQKMHLRIVSLLVQKKTLRHRDLLKILDVASSTLSYHIGRLTAEGIIEVSTYGADKGYRLRDRKLIIRLLLQYELYKLLDDFKDVWEDFSFWE